MRMFNRTIVTAIVTAAIGGGGYAFLGSSLIPSAQAKWAQYPRLERAYRELKEAQDYIESAPHDFHGHRKEAIHAIEVARHWIGVCADDVDSRSGIAPQPLEEHAPLHKALEHLKDAREFVKHAHEDFGGKREEAIGAIDEAIHQIEKCME